jgi:hypothetical protein
MILRIIEGPGALWQGRATVDGAGILIDGRGYGPLDNLAGVVDPASAGP